MKLQFISQRTRLISRPFSLHSGSFPGTQSSSAESCHQAVVDHCFWPETAPGKGNWESCSRVHSLGLAPTNLTFPGPGVKNYFSSPWCYFLSCFTTIFNTYMLLLSLLSHSVCAFFKPVASAKCRYYISSPCLLNGWLGVIPAGRFSVEKEWGIFMHKYFWSFKHSQKADTLAEL